MKVYQSETNEWIEMPVIGKIKYIGHSFGAVSLTSDKVYPVVRIEEGLLGVVDDSDEDYLYSPTNPAPCFDTSLSGKWEIIDDPTGQLEPLITGNKKLVYNN